MEYHSKWIVPQIRAKLNKLDGVGPIAQCRNY